MKRLSPRPYRSILVLWLAAACVPAAVEADLEIPFSEILQWPEEQRAFLQDGPGFLLSDKELETLLVQGTLDREKFIVAFLDRDPFPETPVNELLEGVRRRRELVRQELLTFLDDRSRLLFLHGPPAERVIVDCAETYNPLEIWTYGTDRLVVYRPKPEEPWRLWLPIDSKRRLYNTEMEYWLEQWEEMRGRIFGGRRFDRQICDDSELVDEVTGIDGLFGFLPDRPKNDELKVYLQSPDDLAGWAKAAAGTDISRAPRLEPEPLDVGLAFPARKGLRLVTEATLKLEPGTAFEPFEEGDRQELRFLVEGHLERESKIFERFRMRFQLPAPGPEQADLPIALVLQRNLRPRSEFLMRLKLVEETSGKTAYLNRGVLVPPEPGERPASLVSEEAIVALGEELRKQRIQGYDSLVLIPPETDVVFGLWRAEALVTGTAIAKVAFLLDGEQVLVRRRPPFTAELRLATYPTEQTVRAEGYGSDGELVAFDEVILNQPRGELKVQILAPERGRKVTAGKVAARAEVVVPEEKRVAEVRFLLNDEVQTVLDKPPWETTVEVPPGSELTYLTVTAELDDGSKAEAVRFLNAPDYVEEVEVNLVELFTTVTDGSSRLVRGLERADFQIWEDGRPQEIVKFELVDDLPLTLGIALDASGSMFESLAEAQRAAVGFLEEIITPKDRCFALAFSDRPVLLMPRTSDVGAVAERLNGVLASGSTSLHDAIVTSLYYYRGVRGRRALVLLSDGEDTSSTLDFEEALEYAKRSGVAVFTIGLQIGRFQMGIRRKLENLAQETGGRTFYISEASDLFSVYQEIEDELRSQYLVAYNSDQTGTTGEYREVEVKVRGGRLKARTMRGYYP